MKLVRAWEEEGVEIPKPYSRRIKVLFAPDKEGVSEVSFNNAILPRGGQTDSHTHDRPELIYVVTGEGICVHDGQRTPIEADVALWVPAGEEHQIINTGGETLKLATMFIPPYTAEQTYERCLKAAEKARGETA